MMKTRFGLLSLLIVAMAACSSTPDVDPEEARAIIMAQRPAIDSVPSSGLGPQELPAGECGLFLWSKTDLTKFIFYTKALSDEALFAQGETPITLFRTSAGGSIFGQFNTRMRYQSVDGRKLELEIVPGDILDGGQRIERGLLSLTDSEGWQTKLPVLGVRACQPET